MNKRLKEINKLYEGLEIEEKKYSNRIEYWFGFRWLTTDWICHGCKGYVNIDDVIFATKDGTLSVRDGIAMCNPCFGKLNKGKEKSLKENKKKTSKKIKSK